MNLDGQSVYVTGIATITPTKPVEPKEIEVIEINNATITFKDGDKPVFTGNDPIIKTTLFGVSGGAWTAILVWFLLSRSGEAEFIKTKLLLLKLERPIITGCM